MVKTGTISHIALSASDYEKSKKFYSFLLCDLLGYTKVMDQPYCTMWTLDSSTICVSPGNQTPHHKANPGLHHLAFCTETHDLIDDFYNKIVHFQDENKDMSASVILDKPALYPQYGEGYYGVFFTDPDGIKLELCYTPSH
ncbi:hypothetical protein BG011_007064 [Mortierella polycephala]|uniref:VOC domain-containing protein n=1 Tax=Mortierella polycephala TaxID=41804 RepID=A0A9P6U8M4_9FUNG|nr:hypothetical protein BG011_007064 [Mortierella polycephala]